MSCSVASILVIIFMDKLENIALSSKRFIKPYKRYVDDIYLNTTRENTADKLHPTMNDLHPKIKFETEKLTTSKDGLSL